MHRIFIRNYSKSTPSKNNTWCFKNGYYKYPIKSNKNLINYGKYINENKFSTRKKRQEIMRLYLNQNINSFTNDNGHYNIYDSEY